MDVLNELHKRSYISSVIHFIRTFAAGNKIKQFYELLVEDSLRREDVETMSRENMKNLHEIMQVTGIIISL